jgi:Zn-dependent alcohol dehydrogenase
MRAAITYRLDRPLPQRPPLHGGGFSRYPCPACSGTRHRRSAARSPRDQGYHRRGVEFSFEAVGLKKTAEQRLRVLAPGRDRNADRHGAVRYADRAAGPRLPAHIQGAGSNRFRADMPRLLSAWKKGKLKLDHLISSHFKLDEINEGYAKLKNGGVLLQLIDSGVAA